MDSLSVSKEFLNHLLNYLSGKPYAEVADFIEYIKSEIQTQWEENDGSTVSSESEPSSGD